MTHPNTSKLERKTRLEILKKLAHKHEYLSREDILNQYASFVSKVEKGKYKWGSDADVEKFEHQLVFRWFKFTLKPPYTVVIGNFFLAIWETSHWNFFVKFGLKTA